MSFVENNMGYVVGDKDWFLRKEKERLKCVICFLAEKNIDILLLFPF